VPVETHAPILCPSCGKQFRWKPELAGKRAKCKCGGVIAIPAQPAPAQPADDQDEYDIAPTAAPVAPRAANAVPPPAASGAPAHVEGQPGLSPSAAAAVLQRLGRTAAEVPRAKERLLDDGPSMEDAFKPSIIRDFVLPSILILAGVALSFMEAMKAGPTPAPTIAAAVPIVAMKLVLGVVLVLGGMFLSVVVAEVCFIGPIPLTAFKLTGIAVGVASVYGLLCYALGDTAGAAAGTFAAIALYGLLYWLLMRLDLKDTAICVIITWIVVTAANYIAYKIEGASKDSWI
jgi:hypothetical protein